MQSSKSISQESGQSFEQQFTQRHLQINYYKNMEFFRTYNSKLFQALKNDPLLYNLQVDSSGYNIIHLPSQTLQYPLIPNSRLTHSHALQQNCTRESGILSQPPKISTMLDSHKDLANNPLKNPKWNLFCNFSLCVESNFINQDKLPITGKYYNQMLQSVLHNYHESINEQSCDTDYHNMQVDLARMTSTKAYNNLLNCFIDSKFLPQTTIYGLMGGIFLQDLLNQGFRFHSLMIYEEHIDLFRISLYFLDYKRLFECVKERGCLIVIKDIYPAIIKSFIATKRLTNNFLSLELQHYVSSQTQKLQHLLMQEKKAAMRGWGSFEDEMIGLHNALKNLANCYLLKKPKRVNAPICVIGNGASLDLCLDFIKAYQDSMILFSCGTALKVLRHHGIKPDFQIEIERIGYLSEVLQESKLEDIPLIFAQTTDSKAVNLAKTQLAFMRGGSASAYMDSQAFVLEFSAPFVGNAGVALGALLGSDVILCGIDCGFIKGYSKHAKHSFYGQEKTEIPKDCFRVESNKNLEVYSNDLFYLSAKNISQSLALYKPNTAINLGYGAKIAGTLSLNDDAFFLQKINKPLEISTLQQNFLHFELKWDNHEILTIIYEFSKRLDSILERQIQNLSDLYDIIDSIESLLQELIAENTMRKSIILFEGSTLHLSFSLLLASLFAGNIKCYDIIKPYFKQAVCAMIAHLEQEINSNDSSL